MSSEYGWSDKKIGKLPLVRFRQITAAILTRKYLDDRALGTKVSWAVRQITTYISAGFMLDEGQENKALLQAATIAYDDVEKILLGDASEPQRTQSSDPDNRVGSFEKLMGAFGTR